MFRNIGRAAKIAAFVWFCSAATTVRSADTPTPADKCVLELRLPDGATTTVDGREYGAKRKLTFEQLEPDRRYVCQVDVKFRGGEEESRTLLLQGGWSVQLSLRPPKLGVEPVLQVRASGADKIVFQLDGERYFVEAYSGGVLCERSTGRCLRPFPGTQPFAFDPLGRSVARVAVGNGVEICDAITGETVRMLWGHGDSVRGMAFTRDGRRLLTAAGDGQAILWDIATGDQLQTFQGARWMTCIRFNADGTRLLTNGEPKVAVIWDVATRKMLKSFSFAESVQDLAFSPNGQQFVAHTYRTKAGHTLGKWTICDLGDGKQRHGTEAQGVVCERFSPDGKELVVGRSLYTKENPVRNSLLLIFDATSGKQLRQLDVPRSSISALEFAPDGRELLLMSDDGPIFLEWPSGKERARSKAPVLCWQGEFTLNKDGTRLFGSGAPPSLWELPVCRTVFALPKGKFFTQSLLNGNGDRVISAMSDFETKKSKLIVWDAAKGTPLQTTSDLPYVTHMTIDADGSHALTTYCWEPTNRKADLWDTTTGNRLQTFSGDKETIYRALLSPDGKMAITVSDKKLTLWDASTGQSIRTTNWESGYWARLAFSADSRQFATSVGYGDNVVIKTWETETGRHLHTLKGHQREINALAFSPDGQMLLSGSDDRTVILWDTGDGTIKRRFQGHANEVKAVAFVGPSGRYVMTAGVDGLRLWDVATGDELTRIVRVNNSPDWLAVSPDGFFDGPKSALDRVMFRVGTGLDVAPVASLSERFHRSGLLRELLDGQRPAPLSLAVENKAPTLRVLSPQSSDTVKTDGVTLEVELSAHGGGIAGPWLRHNGARIEKAEPGKTAGRFLFSVPLTPGNNHLEVHAASADGAWRSAPVVLRRQRKEVLEATAAAGPELVLQTGHSDTILFAIPSPDNQFVITGAEDGTAILWELDTCQQVHTLRGHAEKVCCAAFRPDGKQVVTGDSKGTAIVWDVESGRRVRSFGHDTWGIERLQYTPDGKQILTAARDRLAFTEAATGRLLRSIPTGTTSIHDVALSPDGKVAMAAIGDKQNARVLLWNAETGAQTMEFPGLETDHVEHVAFLADGKRAIHVWDSQEMGAIVWDLAEKQKLFSLIVPDTNIGPTAVSSDGRMAISALHWQPSLDRLFNNSSEGSGAAPDPGNAAIWDTASGKILKSLGGGGGVISVLATSADGRRVFFSGYRQPGILVDVATGKWFHMFREANDIKSAAISPDGHRLVYSVGNDIVVSDADTGNQVARFQRDPSHNWDAGVCLSPDGQQILGASASQTATIWDAGTGREVRQFQGATYIRTAIFSPDGRRILVGGINEGAGEAVLWDAESGRQLRTFRAANRFVDVVAFSPDGNKLIASTSSYNNPTDGKIMVFNASTGETVQVLSTGKNGAKAAAFSADGHRLFILEAYSNYEDQGLAVWNLDTGKPLRRFRQSNQADAMALSGDGRQLFTSDSDAVNLWDLENGIAVRKFQRHKWMPSGVQFSADNRRVITNESVLSGVPLIWNAETGLQEASLRPRAGAVSALCFSPDGRRIAAATNCNGCNIVLWDLTLGQQLRVLGSLGKQAQKLAFSPDGRYLAALRSSPELVVVWDVATGRQTRALHPRDTANDMAFTSNGRHLAIAGGKYKEEGYVAFWDPITGQLAHEIHGHTNPIKALAFSPDGREMLTGGSDRTVCLWDVASRRKLQVFEAKDQYSSHVASVAFGPDGRTAFAQCWSTTFCWNTATGEKLREFTTIGAGEAAVASNGRFAALWSTVWSNDQLALYDLATGTKLHALMGHASKLTSVTVSPDSRLVATGSTDGTARLWDVEKGEELVRMISVDGGMEWVTATPDGLFDGSPGGRQVVAFRVAGRNRPVPVDRFFNDFYRAGLLASVSGGNRLKADIKIGKNLPPTLKILSPKSGSTTTATIAIEVEALDQGGGVAEMAIYQNGARLLAPGPVSRDETTVHKAFQVGLVEGRNHFRITAASNDGSWEAEPVELLLDYQEPAGKNDLHVVAVGINRYADATLNLNYAAKDAHALAELFRRRGKQLYQQVHVTEILDQQATRSGIKAALKDAASKTARGDTLVVIMAGHGTMVGQRYYFVPHDLRREADRLEDDIRKQGIPADDLSDYLTAAQALKRVLVLDTCASGGALASALKGRSGFAFRGAIERLARASGVFTIAASSATEEAQESKELRHGVLTYALLAGLKAVDTGPLADKHAQPSGSDRVVDTLEWLNFAAGHVPRITERLYGSPQDVQIGVLGQSFPVLPLED